MSSNLRSLVKLKETLTNKFLAQFLDTRGIHENKGIKIWYVVNWDVFIFKEGVSSIFLRIKEDLFVRKIKEGFFFLFKWWLFVYWICIESNPTSTKLDFKDRHHL